MAYREDLSRMAKIYEGIAIFGVEPGTTSHRAGVRPGDILIGVNGRRVRRLSDYAAARRARTGHLELLVVRQGKLRRLFTSDAQVHPRVVVIPKLTCGWIGAA